MVSRLADVTSTREKNIGTKGKTPRVVPEAFGKSRPLSGDGDDYGFVGVGVVAAGFVAAGAGCVAAGFAAAGFAGVAAPPLTGYA
jgi:hypothetical protein